MIHHVGTHCKRFLSTPSARRATVARCSFINPTDISIHALREEGDTGADIDALELDEFLSTPSARRATCPARCPA